MFSSLRVWNDALGSHWDSGELHVSILDDHDHVSGEKARFSTDAASDHQVAAAVAIQLFSLGIPCIYYGTEQSFAGPEREERRRYLPDFGSHDKFLREAMFGPEHPRRPGAAGLAAIWPSCGASIRSCGMAGSINGPSPIGAGLSPYRMRGTSSPGPASWTTRKP